MSALVNGMINWKCGYCNEFQGPLYVDEDVTYIECEFCERKYTIYLRVVDNQ